MVLNIYFFYGTCNRYKWDDFGGTPIFVYPLVNYHNYGKSPYLLGKFSMSMAIFNSKLLVYQRVYTASLGKLPKKNGSLTRVSPGFARGGSDRGLRGASRELHGTRSRSFGVPNGGRW